MNGLYAFTQALAHLAHGDGQTEEEKLRLLQDMFRGSDFTQSVLTTVLDEHQGRIDNAVDTLLNLANDPLRGAYLQQQQPQLPSQDGAAATPPTPTAAAEDKKDATPSPLTVTEPRIPPKQAPAERAQSRCKNDLNRFLNELAQEDARLLEELRLLDEERRAAVAPATPIAAPTPVPSPAVVSPSSSGLVTTSSDGAPENEDLCDGNGSEQEQVLSVLHTQALFASDLDQLIPSTSKQPLPESASTTTTEKSTATATTGSSMATALRKLVCPASARLGDVVAVSWDLGPGSEPSEGDWIGLFKQNQPSNSQYAVYKKTGGAKQGILDVAAPGIGTWEFRFFPNNSYEYSMKSNLLIVGPQLELVASLNEDASTIRFSCKLLSGQVSARDWVGLYSVDTYHNKQYLEMRYMIDINETLTFSAPKTPGHYELRYFPMSSSYNDVARSNLVIIENRDMVIAAPSRVVHGSDEQLIATWQIHSVPTSKWDWIGLYPIDSQTYVEYHYVNPNEPTCTFKVPEQPGQYELRYFSSATSSFLTFAQQRRSTKVTVLPPTTSSRSTI